MPRRGGKRRVQLQQTVVVASAEHERRREIEKEMRQLESHLLRLRESQRTDVVERYYQGCEICGLEWKYKQMLMELDTLKRGVEE